MNIMWWIAAQTVLDIVLIVGLFVIDGKKANK